MPNVPVWGLASIAVLLTYASIACRETEGGRLVVHVECDLCNQQSKAKQAEAKCGKCIAFKVSVKELKQLLCIIA